MHSENRLHWYACLSVVKQFLALICLKQHFPVTSIPGFICWSKKIILLFRKRGLVNIIGLARIDCLTLVKHYNNML